MENFNSLHDICLKVFESISKTTTIFVLPLFLCRIVFSNVMGDGSKSFATLKGAVLYFCLIAGFPYIVEILFSIPDAYLPKYQSLASLTADSPGWQMSVIPFSVDRVLEVLLAGLYWVVYYLHVFFMLVMCSMAPIVFLISTLLGVGMGIEIFMGLMIVGSSWPIIWYGFDQVHANLVSAQADGFGAKCLEVLVTLFKGLSPMAFATLAVKSPAGRAVSQMAQASISGGKWLAVKGGVMNAHSGPSFSKNFSSSKKQNSNIISGRARSFPVQGEKTNRLNEAKIRKSKERGELKNENPRSRNI